MIADVRGKNSLCQHGRAGLAVVLPLKIQLGTKLTARPGFGRQEIGRRAALEDTEKLIEAMEVDMVFVTTGLGGGTGTGGAPIVASLARELGALMRAVTKPFALKASAACCRRNRDWRS